MPEAKGGFLISFEPGRREILRETGESRDRFSVELSTSDWPLGQKEMFFLSFSDNRDEFDCAAVMRRKAGPRNTAGQNIEFHGLVFFEPLRMSVLRVRLPERASATIKDREGARGWWFPPAAWTALLELVKEERPDVATELDDLWARVNAQDVLTLTREIQRLALQRDAIGLSFDIAGLSNLRRQEFRKARPIDDHAGSVQSFIHLMDTQPPQERMLVEHDRSVLETVIAQGDYDTQTFSEGPRRLRVWTVDRGKVERFAGVDLVILNQDFNSLLLVQYKCLEREDVRADQSWHYRPDPQFDNEIARLERVRRLIRSKTAARSKMEDLRLHRGALYFKFCKRLPLSKQDGELAEGMIMSLSATQALLQSPDSLGPKGGRFIGYANCDRYLTNSLFSALARDGWIGTRGLTGRQYEEVLGFVQDGETRSLVLAETRTVIAPNAPRASRRARS